MSNFGRVKSLPRPKMSRWGTTYMMKGGILKPHTNERGYRIARLAVDGETKTEKVHRLVLLAFHGDPPEGCDITRHLDGDPGNNHPSNLAWGTHKENGEDMSNHGRSPRGERSGRAVLSAGDVREMRSRRAAGEQIGALAAEFGVARSTASVAINGVSWRHL